ncbi:serine hydrolase domain-containing protein [Chelativorans sp. YIM 93263]|uniref:serine hydrolase domain-containing protein n=1 Tax=Chelativorans sp. YIM 93263 TaxID=2906648 RepID=UPI002379355A|nr:serine hydrolase [Chelativorans sp. YIM 93263]
MRIAVSIVKWLMLLAGVLLLSAAIWLWFAPPDLIRVGSNYAAKTVCSNVFLAGRLPEDVLADDVQAPGHPLLKLMRVDVNPMDATVRAGLLRWFGKGTALFRGGTGCVAAPDGQLQAARGGLLDMATPSGGPATLWPEGARIDAAGHPEISNILDDPAMTGPGMRAVVVVHEGRIIGERLGPNVYHHEQPLIGWSMTKPVNAAIVGTLVRAGRLSVDDASLFPAWEGDGRSEITIAHLLGMESGLAFRESYDGVTDVTRMLYLEPDMAAFAAAKPLAHDVGEHFSYSSGSSVLAARAWQDTFEDPEAALRWPREAFFEPLGMDTAVFETDARGTFVGSSYLYASPRDWARFGQLLLQDGEWNGQQILPEGWVEWMRTPTEASGGDYGRGLWMHGPRVTTPPDQHQDTGFDLPDDAYWMIGHDGQTITIIPSRDLVVVRMGLTPTILAYKPQSLVEAVVKALDERKRLRAMEP